MLPTISTKISSTKTGLVILTILKGTLGMFKIPATIEWKMIGWDKISGVTVYCKRVLLQKGDSVFLKTVSDSEMVYISLSFVFLFGGMGSNRVADSVARKTVHFCIVRYM